MLCPRLPHAPSFLPRWLGSPLLILTGETRYVFPILHLNVTIVLLHAGTGGRFRGSCRDKREGGGPVACQHAPLPVTRKTGGGGLGNARHRYILFWAKQASPRSTLPPPIQKKIIMKIQLWEFIYIALNFNLQQSLAQCPLITTRPVNARCLEWKQRVKIPVWIFSWKSVIENHLSVRQN